MSTRNNHHRISWYVFACLLLALIGVGVTASAGSSYAALPPTASQGQATQAGGQAPTSLTPEEYRKYYELGLPHQLRDIYQPEAPQAASGAPDGVSQPLTECLTVLPSANPGSGHNQLFGVDVVSETLGWAVGTYTDTAQQLSAMDSLPDAPGDYKPLILRYDGNNWENDYRLSLAVTSRLYSVSAFSSTSAIAVGAQKPGSTWLNLGLKWNGVSWDEISLPNVGTGQNHLLSVDGNMAAGYYEVPGLALHTLILKGLDSTPQIITSTDPGTIINYLTSIAMVPGTNDAWAAGYYLNSSFYYQPLIMRSQNNGPWVNVTPPFTNTLNFILNGVSVAAPNSVFFAGHQVINGQTDPFILHFDGTDIVQLQTPSLPYSENIYAIDIVWVPGLGAMGEAVGASNSGSGDIPYAIKYDGSTFSPSYLDEFLGQYYGVNYNYNTPSYRFVSRTGVEWFFPPRRGGETATGGGRMLTLATLTEDPCGGPQPTPTPGGPTPTPGPPTATPTPCTPGQFSDVPPSHTFYPFITCLVNNGVISGYPNCTFRPNNNITRGQLSKVVSNAANFTEPVSGQTFEDIAVGSTFYDFVERLASRSVIGGYACGGPGEPCVPPNNRPYFRPNANSTRGQISKIVAVARGYQDPMSNQTFEDVGVGSTFHLWIENLASRSIMSGYPCGGPGEPCVPPGNRPYFRPQNNATRGQTSKIVANTFFPNCQTR